MSVFTARYPMLIQTSTEEGAKCVTSNRLFLQDYFLALLFFIYFGSVHVQKPKVSQSTEFENTPLNLTQNGHR